MDDITIEKYLSMTPQEQASYIEDVLIYLWENNEIDLVGFNQYNEPLFSYKKGIHPIE